MVNAAYHRAMILGDFGEDIPEHLDPNGMPTVSVPVPHDFIPKSAADFLVCLSDPEWRLYSGVLYKIMIKESEDEDSDSLVVPFKPNRAQRRLLKRMHKRNIILKARQLGFTTLICIYFLDCVLFRKDVRAGIIAHVDDVAKVLFRDKVKFAYDNLPPQMKELFPLKKDSQEELHFAHNNSSIRVSTSMRGGTLQYLHISEFGKICAKYPDRADEVMTGALPTVSTNGMVFIESTAEGRNGHFYSMTTRARKLADLVGGKDGRRLTPKEYKFHFYPWWQDQNYRMISTHVAISANEDEYFDKIEGEMNTSIDVEQRAWYISTRDNEFAGEESKMWQEYPSTPDEAFQVSNKAMYYSRQMAKVRKEKRIGKVLPNPSIPFNTFWDIGSSDGCAVWFHQQVGAAHHFINFEEGWGESYAYFVKKINDFANEHGLIIGRHHLPHDGAHERQGEVNNNSPQTMLGNLGLRNIEIVPRVSELQHGISATRDFLAISHFDEERCKEGINHLDSYRRAYNEKLQCFMDVPLKDVHTEGADSYRQAAQVFVGNNPSVKAGQRPKRRNSSGMAA